MRRKIYGVNEENAGEGAPQQASASNNVEIAMNLCKLREVEHAMGNRDAAMAFILKGRKVYDMLLSRECGRLGGSCVPSMRRNSVTKKNKHGAGQAGCRAALLRLLASCGSSSSLILLKLLRQSIQAASWERKLAKAAGDAKREEIVSEELVQLRAVWTLLGTQSKKKEDGDAIILSSSPVSLSSSTWGLQVSPSSKTAHGRQSIALLGEALTACRTDVRVRLRNVSKGECKDGLATALRERVGAMEQFVLKNQVGFGPCTEMMAAGSAFFKAVRAAAAVGSREKRLRTEVFQACDVLREALREGGLEIED